MYEYDEDEDCEYEGLAKKALPIPKLSEKVDLSIPPSTALDYIRQVRFESLRYPDLFIAQVDPKKLKPKRPHVFTTLKGITPAPSGYAPSKAWRIEQVRSFSDMRLLVSKKKAAFRQNPKLSSGVSLPRINDEDYWHRFCFGNEIEKGGEDENPKTVDESCEPKLPLMSVVLQLVQPKIEILLSYHIKWMKQYGFSHHLGCWVYSLMACFDKPLTPNGCDLLRKLARDCADLRSKLDSNTNEFLKPLNLIICLVAYYFDQTDMGDKQDEDQSKEEQGGGGKESKDEQVEEEAKDDRKEVKKDDEEEEGEDDDDESDDSDDEEDSEDYEFD